MEANTPRSPAWIFLSPWEGSGGCLRWEAKPSVPAQLSARRIPLLEESCGFRAVDRNIQAGGLGVCRLICQHPLSGLREKTRGRLWGPSAMSRAVFRKGDCVKDSAARRKNQRLSHRYVSGAGRLFRAAARVKEPSPMRGNGLVRPRSPVEGSFSVACDATPTRRLRLDWIALGVSARPAERRRRTPKENTRSQTEAEVFAPSTGASFAGCLLSPRSALRPRSGGSTR
jgi:hypothetical protein